MKGSLTGREKTNHLLATNQNMLPLVVLPLTMVLEIVGDLSNERGVIPLADSFKIRFLDSEAVTTCHSTFGIGFCRLFTDV